MKTKPNNFASASALRITFSITLIFVSAILLTLAAVATPTLGNYPDTSLPLSTDTTVTPDAPPTNTTSINVSTSTDFKGTLAGDPATGVVRVTDAHPAGTYTVAVTAFDSGGESATKTFTLTVITPVTCLPVGFSAATSFRANIIPVSVAIGDFNGDGKQDLAVADLGPWQGGTGGVSILLGDGTGNFSAPRRFVVAKNPFLGAVGDFNGDGKQDLVVIIGGTRPDYNGGLSILLGDGAGNFSAPTNFDFGNHPGSVAVGDFNGDGKQDLVVSNGGYGENSVSIFLGNGAGHFSGPTIFDAGISPQSVKLGDFDGDGKQDLAVISSGGVSILLGDGAGGFSAPTTFGVSYPSALVVGDFNGDGKQDVAVTYRVSDSVSILLGDGAGNLSAPTSFPVGGDDPLGQAVGDFNGDGKQDLVFTFQFSTDVSILLGDGAGNFNALINVAVGNPQTSIAVGDFNGDGKQDLTVVSGGVGVSILLRDCEVPVSQITPAETTCSQFASGTAETLGSVNYDVYNDLIQRIVPRNFLYWVPVTAPAGNNIVRVTQTITTGNFNTFFAGKGNGSNVFDSNCVSLQRAGSQSGDTATVKFNAPAAGTYFIAINFNAQSLLGQPAPSPTTVHYDFTTTGVPDSTSGLDLLEH